MDKCTKLVPAINACKEALEQPAQEPVVWKYFDEAYKKASQSSQPRDWFRAALLAQQVRNNQPAQPLSDDEIAELLNQSGWPTVLLSDFVASKMIEFTRAVEQAHGIGVKHD